MMKKCDANCDARRGADQYFNGYHLWLRNDIFYFRVELPKENNKRRYKRIVHKFINVSSFISF